MLAMSKWFTLTPFMSNRFSKRVGFSNSPGSVRAHVNGGGDDTNNSKNNDKKKQKKVVVVGSGWAGLGAAHHLCKQVLTIFAYRGNPVIPLSNLQ